MPGAEHEEDLREEDGQWDGQKEAADQKDLQTHPFHRVKFGFLLIFLLNLENEYTCVKVLECQKPSPLIYLNLPVFVKRLTIS